MRMTGRSKCMDYEAEGVRPRGRPKKAWSGTTEKRLSDPTNMQGRCHGLYCRKWRKLITDVV